MNEEIKNDKRKVLLILGNGFDLACGYKTKFDDFYNHVTSHDSNLNNFNFFIQMLRETFYKAGDTSKAFQKLLDINCKENWMDLELLLNHFLYGKMYDYTKRVFKSFTPVGYVGSTSFPEIVLQTWLSNCTLNLKNGVDCFLMDHLHQFEISLSKYLEDDATKSYYDSRRVDKIFYQLVDANDDVKLINFNYTMPIEEKQNVHICFVHGSIYEKNIIIGVDSTKIENNADIDKKRIFTKTFRKMSLDLSKCDDNKALEKGIYKIVFYGHSLGKQDYSYFQSIFDFYDLYNSEIILEFCYSEYDSKREISEREVLTNRIYDLINLYGTTLDNKEHGKNMLHKLLLENRIVLKEIIIPSLPTQKIMLK